MPTVAFVTLGCKVNQFDTQAVREALERRGVVEAGPGEGADAYVVNTCCVTRESHREGLRRLRRLARDHPEAVVVAAGCSVDAYPEDFGNLDGLDLAVGNEAKPDLPRMLAEALGLRAAAGEPSGPWPAISRVAGHTRAFVKVQDGCDAYCAYCIVAHVRGPVRSRPPEEVVAEVGRLVANGYREVVLTGIHLGCYGRDSQNRWALAPLVERLAAVPGLRRLRLSSLEVGEVSDDLLDLMAASPVVCPHVHMPLQSGDDDVLRRMNRRYTAARFLDRVEAIRARVPEPALTTDVIVGFPGETDAQFRRTVEACRAAGFGRIHVFPYSDRPGTAAARMEGKLSREAIKARREEMLAAARELAEAWHRRFVGRDIEVLVESRRDRRTGKLCGYSGRYVRAFFDGPEALAGQFVAVRAHGAGRRGVTGVAVQEPGKVE